MNNDAQPDETDRLTDASTSGGSAEWLEIFCKHLDIEYTNIHAASGHDDSDESRRRSMAKALVVVFRESGADKDEIIQLLQSQARDLVPVETSRWTDQKNERRVELIEMSISNKLRPSDELELDLLTEQLRAECDTEQYIPLEGVGRLRDQLRDLDKTSKEQK